MCECLHHEDGDGDCIRHACTNCYHEIYGELLPLRAENERLKSRLDALHRSKYEYGRAENDRLRDLLSSAKRYFHSDSQMRAAIEKALAPPKGEDRG